MADGKFVKGMRICKICGRDFPLIAEEAYIARDNERVGIVNAIENKEVTIYDAIDCPHCGAQNILQERKRFADVEDGFDEYEEDPEGPVGTTVTFGGSAGGSGSISICDGGNGKLYEDLDARVQEDCEGCKHEGEDGSEFPCNDCCRAYYDRYTEAKKDGSK